MSGCVDNGDLYLPNDRTRRKKREDPEFQASLENQGRVENICSSLSIH